MIGTVNSNGGGGSGGCSIGTSAPKDTKLLWVDTSSSTPLLKYYDGSSWVHLNTAVWG